MPNTENKPMDKPVDELKVYSDKPQELPSKIKDLEGNDVVISKLSLGQEIDLYGVFSDFLASLPKNLGEETDAAEESNLKLLKEIPLFYLKAAVPILKMPEEELKNKFDLATLKELVDPFFGKFVNGATLGTAVPQIAQLPNSLVSTSTTADGQSKKP